MDLSIIDTPIEPWPEPPDYPIFADIDALQREAGLSASVHDRLSLYGPTIKGVCAPLMQSFGYVSIRMVLELAARQLIPRHRWSFRHACEDWSNAHGRISQLLRTHNTVLWHDHLEAGDLEVMAELLKQTFPEHQHLELVVYGLDSREYRDWVVVGDKSRLKADLKRATDSGWRVEKPMSADAFAALWHA